MKTEPALRPRRTRRLPLHLAAAGLATLLAALAGPSRAEGIPGVGPVPEVPAFLPMVTAVPAADAMPVDGTWSITSIGKTVRIERGRVYAVEGWTHLFVLKIQPGMVVIKDLRPSAPGQYTAYDLPLMGAWQGRMTADRTIAVDVQGALGPAKYQMMPLQLDNPEWYQQALAEAGLAGPGSAAPGSTAPGYSPPAYQPPSSPPPEYQQPGYQQPVPQQPGSPAPPPTAEPGPVYPQSGSSAPGSPQGTYQLAAYSPSGYPPASIPGPDFPPAHANPVRAGRPAKLGCDGKQLYFSARNGGECWQCPSGFGRNASMLVTSDKACAQRNSIGAPKIIKGPFRSATYVRSVWGCPASQFHMAKDGGSCMTCPTGYRRSQVLGIDSQSCRRVESDADLLRRYALEIGGQLGPQLQVLGEIRACMMNESIKADLVAAIKGRDLRRATSLKDRCVSQTQTQILRSSARAGSNRTPVALNVGLSGGAMFGAGLGGGGGFSWDLTGSRSARFFTTGEGAFGVGGIASGDVVVGFGIDSLPAQPGLQRGTSVVAAGKFIAGLGVSIDFSRESPLWDVMKDLNGVSDTLDGLFDEFEGAAVSGGAGVGAEFGTIHTSRTRYW